MFFISPAFAEATQAAAQPSAAAGFLPILIIFAIFYFLLIRPQQKRIKAHNDMIRAVKKGDEVITSGGIIGKIKKLEGDDIVHLEIAKDTIVQVVKSTLANVRGKSSSVADSTNATKSKK